MTRYMDPPPIYAGADVHSRPRHAYAPDCDEAPHCTPAEDGNTEDTNSGVTYDPPPSHYDGGNGLDVWAIWRAFELDAWEGALTKYILRAGKKEGESKLKDLKKARNYLAYLIEREERSCDS